MTLLSLALAFLASPLSAQPYYSPAVNRMSQPTVFDSTQPFPSNPPASSGPVINSQGIRFPDGSVQTTAGGGAADLVRSSATSFGPLNASANIEVALATVTLTTRGYPVYATFVGTLDPSGGAGNATLYLLVDGDYLSGRNPKTDLNSGFLRASTDGISSMGNLSARIKVPMSIPAGSHTFAVIVYDGAGTGVVGDSSLFNQFLVEEVPE